LPLTPCDRASGDFAHAVDGDAGALFDSERVVGGFELDEGALPTGRVWTWVFRLMVLGGVDRHYEPNERA
jgi:hypothetical protein